MKTKLIPFEAPKESVIYNPPLKVKNCENHKEYDLVAYIKNVEFSFVCKQNSFRSIEPFLIEVPDEPQIMTNLQLMQLLNRGGWVCLYSNNYASLCPVFAEPDLYSSVKGIKVSRINKIEWIEPTTDLLEL